MTRTASIERPAVDIGRFESGDVAAEEFTHTAHVYVAWLYLTETTLPDAIERYSSALKRLTHKLGVEGKYHETITWFYLIVIAERMSRDGVTGWADFAANNADLLADGAPLLTRSYSTKRLGSRLARRQFVLPDLAPPG